MAQTHPRPPATASALIVVMDGALASSLELMLEACDVAANTHDPRLGLSPLPLETDDHLLADFELFRDPSLFLLELRATGWLGAAILMTERALDETWSRPGRCWTIEKPFGSADLLAILHEIVQTH
jgi:hypothetical protein